MNPDTLDPTNDINGPHDLVSLDRRDFMAMLAKTALLLTLAGGSRTYAAETRAAGGSSYALNPLVPLCTRTPRGAPSSSPGRASLTGLVMPGTAGGPFTRWHYRWVSSMVFSGKPGRELQLEEIGSLQIRRTAFADRVEYSVEQKRTFADYEATLICGPEAGEPLREWRSRQVHTEPRFEPLVSVVEGRVDGSEVAIQRGQILEKRVLSAPLYSDLALLVHPASLTVLEDQTITLLEGAAMIRPDVLVRRDTMADAGLGGLTCLAWLMTGRGLLPTHVMVDGNERALCRTGFTNSLVLQDISS
jgi:hypothetical protein